MARAKYKELVQRVYENARCSKNQNSGYSSNNYYVWAFKSTQFCIAGGETVQMAWYKAYMFCLSEHKHLYPIQGLQAIYDEQNSNTTYGGIKRSGHSWWRKTSKKKLTPEEKKKVCATLKKEFDKLKRKK